MDRIPKLILVDGLPGTGKSTLSQEISLQLRANGIEAALYFESQLDNPLRPLGYLSCSTGMDLIELSLKHWSKLFRKLEDSDSITLIDGGLFQNSIRFFFHNELPYDAIVHYATRIERYLNDLDGVAFYLTHHDVAALWKSTVTNRGEGFANSVCNYIENTKLSRIYNSEETDKAVSFFSHYQALCNKIFKELNVCKCQIDISSNNWLECNQTACDHLGIQYQKHLTAHFFSVGDIIGKYVDTDTGYSCEIKVCEGQLCVTNILMPFELESVLIKTVDCGEDMLNLRGSPVYIKFEPNGGFMEIISHDNWGGLNGKILKIT
jgi:hypothetical protein